MSIRENVRGLIFKENVDSDESIESSQLKFTSFRPKKDIFKAIFEDLSKKVNAEGYFYNSDQDRKVGYLSDIYGCTAILALASDGSVLLNQDQKESLLKNIRYILKEIDEFGFTLYPYISGIDNEFYVDDNGEKIKHTLFNNSYPYIGALTWTISFLAAIKRSSLRNDDKDEEEHRFLELDDDLLSEINHLIVKIVDYFNTSVITAPNPNNPEELQYLGWSYTKDCVEPSLFFTYSVLEAFSDFEDSVLEVEKDANGYVIRNGNLVRHFKDSESDLEKLFEVKSGLNGVEQWANACASVAKNIWRIYGEVLKDDFVDDKFLEGFGVIRYSDILKMDHSNSLFNNVFLVSSLLYGYANILIPEESKEIVSTMEIALQNVQRAIDSLTRKNMDYIVGSYIIPFTNFHKRFGDMYIRKLNYRRISDTTLLPMLMKANNMIAVYITQFPVKKMDVLFEQIFDETNICDEEMLWDDKGYDVKITERYIEAIDQFYEYYVAYEEDYTIGFENARLKGRKIGFREGVSLQKSRNKEELAKKDEDKKLAIEEVRKEYSIENILVARFNEIAEKKILSALAVANERIAKHDWNQNKTKDATTFEDKVENLFISLVENYLSSKVDSLLKLEGRELTQEEVLNRLKEELSGKVLKRLSKKEGE